MTDHFALLGEPRRPWLDTDPLKAKFLALSAEAHPDRVHRAGDDTKLAATERSAGLNAAYQCLRAPKERLFHLLCLELGQPPAKVEAVPSGLAELFMQANRLCAETDAVLAENAGVT